MLFDRNLLKPYKHKVFGILLTDSKFLKLYPPVALTYLIHL